MKKLLIILLIIIITIISFLVGYKLKHYTQKDLDRILDIYVEKEKPTKLDYYRLDLNKDNVIDLEDGVIAYKKVK